MCLLCRCQNYATMTKTVPGSQQAGRTVGRRAHLKIQESAEDYLEAILAIREKKGTARSIDVAQHLGFSKPSVSRAMSLLRENGYEVAAYSGYTFEELLDGTPEQRELLNNIDVLIDGPFLLAERTLEARFRGSRNQRIINVPQSLREGKAVLERSERWGGGM